MKSSLSSAGLSTTGVVFFPSIYARYGRRSTLESTLSQSVSEKNFSNCSSNVGSYHARRPSLFSSKLLYFRNLLLATVLTPRYSVRSGFTPLLAESISRPVRIARVSVSSRHLSRSSSSEFSLYAIMLLLSAALDICPTREENVLLTVSKRACQSVASRITGSALGIFNSGVSAFELRLTQRFTIGSEIVFIMSPSKSAPPRRSAVSESQFTITTSVR